MLGEMRNRSGGPNWVLRVLAVLLALLLAGPFTVLVLRGVLRLLEPVF